MSSMTIAGNKVFFPRNSKGIIWDNPNKGGITGTHKDKIPPYACEERTKIYDVRTGEDVYLDEYHKNNPFIRYQA